MRDLTEQQQTQLLSRTMSQECTLMNVNIEGKGYSSIFKKNKTLLQTENAWKKYLLRKLVSEVGCGPLGEAVLLMIIHPSNIKFRVAVNSDS